MSDEATDGVPVARSWWRRLVIGAVVGVLVAVPTIVVWGLAASGGLRFRTPVAEMKESMALFEAPPGASLVTSNTYGQRVCFLQCSDWSIRSQFVMEPGVAPEDLCEILKPLADDWAGSETDSFRPIGPTTCVHIARSFRGNNRWRARVVVRASSVSDFYVSLTQTYPSEPLAPSP